MDGPVVGKPFTPIDLSVGGHFPRPRVEQVRCLSIHSPSDTQDSGHTYEVGLETQTNIVSFGSMTGTLVYPFLV